MNKKDHLIFLKHILESIRSIESFSKGLSKGKFENDRLKRSAILRELEIIGEAAKNIPPSFKNKHPEVPWKEIIGTRDIIIHHYFGVDLDIVWNIINKNLPDLKKKIENILKNKEKEK